MKASNIVKAVGSLCFILIAVALLAIRDSPATGYESSIYASTPPLVWGSLIVCVACGIGIVVYQVWRREDHSNLWIIGYALILSCGLILISLHALRGYAFWNASGDSGTVLGWVQGSVSTGHVRSGDVYPMVTVYLSELAQIMGVSNLPTLQHWLGVFHSLFSMVTVYVLAIFFLPRRGQVILATIAGSSLFYVLYFGSDQTSLANSMFPLALYLLGRSLTRDTLQWRILFTILIFWFPLAHPVPAMALFSILLTISVVGSVLHLSTGTPGMESGPFKFDVSITLLLFVWAITWISSFYVWDAMIINLHTLLTGGGATHITALADNILYATKHGYSVAAQFFKVYGSTLLYITLTLVAVPMLAKRFKASEHLKRLISLYAPLAAIALATIIFYMANLAFGPSRLLLYIMVMSSLFVGFVLYELMDWSALRGGPLAKIAPFLVAVLLLLVSATDGLRLYPSPYTLQPSYHNTRAEIEGMDWFLHNKDTAVGTAGWYLGLHRFADFLLDPEERRQRYKDVGPRSVTSLPWHLGYEEYSTIGESYEKDVYVVFSQMSRRVYVDVYPEMAELRILPSDFAKMDNDPTVDKLYENGGFDVWYVHTTAK